MTVSSKSAGAKLLLLTLLSAAGLMATATAATVYTAGDGRRRIGPTTTDANLDAARSWIPLRALTDSLVLALGTLPATDSLTLTKMVALVAIPSDSGVWIAHGPTEPDPIAAQATYRAWARSAPLPPFWGLRSVMPAAIDSRAVRFPRLQVLKKLWRANEAAADSALLAGNTTVALMRARENIAGARHLVWQPTPITALVGRTMLSDGAKLLARSALQANDPALHSAAQRLATMAKALQVVPRGGWPQTGAMSADPRNGRLLSIAADRTVHPATRFFAIEIMVASTCLNTRDVLFGPSSARYASIDAMIDSERDIPRMTEMRPLFHRTLERFDQSPGASLRALGIQGSRQEPWTESLLRLMVPRRVQDRVDFCRANGL